jgi:hypothetical protein
MMIEYRHGSTWPPSGKWLLVNISNGMPFEKLRINRKVQYKFGAIYPNAVIFFNNPYCIIWISDGIIYHRDF